MSKAFTKEQESNDSEALDDEGPDSLLLQAQGKNYITPQGANRLKEELKALLYTERPEVVKTVSWAASNGDRSENGDYIYGKRRLREIDRRVRFLNRRLDAAVIIDPATQKGDVVLFGASVTVRDEEAEERTYRIVGIDETDLKRGHVSWISPVGRALLQSRKGDLVTLKTPKGDEELEILEIRYLAQD
jgi:transcription elongation factor GreB